MAPNRRQVFNLAVIAGGLVLTVAGMRSARQRHHDAQVRSAPAKLEKYIKLMDRQLTKKFESIEYRWQLAHFYSFIAGVLLMAVALAGLFFGIGPATFHAVVGLVGAVILVVGIVVSQHTWYLGDWAYETARTYFGPMPREIQSLYRELENYYARTDVVVRYGKRVRFLAVQKPEGLYYAACWTGRRIRYIGDITTR